MPSGNRISPATPSPSITSSRASESHAPESERSRPRRHSALMSAIRNRLSAAFVISIWIGSAASNAAWYLFSR
jgi:hypothetical protein